MGVGKERVHCLKQALIFICHLLLFIVFPVWNLPPTLLLKLNFWLVCYYGPDILHLKYTV